MTDTTSGGDPGNGPGGGDGIFTKAAPPDRGPGQAAGAAKRMSEVLGEACPRTCSDGSSG